MRCELEMGRAGQPHLHLLTTGEHQCTSLDLGFYGLLFAIVALRGVPGCSETAGTCGWVLFSLNAQMRVCLYTDESCGLRPSTCS
jgi:hypothetical protein